MSVSGYLCLVLILGLTLAGCVPRAMESNDSVVVVPPVPSLAAYNVVALAAFTADGGERDPFSLEPIATSALASMGFRLIPFEVALASDSQVATRVLLGEPFWTFTAQPRGYVSVFRLVLRDLSGALIHSVEGTGDALSRQRASEMAANEAMQRLRAAYPGFDRSVSSTLENRLRTWPRGQSDESQIVATFASRQHSLNEVEGIWTSGDQSLRIAVMAKPETDSRVFEATILNAQGAPLWQPGMIKMTLERTAAAGAYSVTYWTSDLRSVGTTAVVRDAIMTLNIAIDEARPSLPQFIKVFPDAPASITGSGQAPPTTGSGFLVSETGLVATNAHVVDGRTRIRVALLSGAASFEAQVVSIDRSNDLALLRLDGFEYETHFAHSIPYALVDSTEVAAGDSVLAVGFPVSTLLGGELRATDGIVSALSGILGAPNVFQITASIQPGNSGGPLFDEYGDVVGVVVATVNAGAFLGITGSLPQNINFAVKSPYLRALLGMAPGPVIAQTRTTTEMMRARDIISRSADYIASIEAE